MITGIASLIALTLLAQDPSQVVEDPPNAFSAIETHSLSNGLKVWFKNLPDDPVISISVALPFGSDMDPPGKDQLAHFTEHMLFSDQPGLSEEEIRRQIEERGGVYNASVTVDRTFYFVRIGKEHAEFAIDWLFRIIQPHAMTEEVVELQREPVALEVGARPRQFFDWLWAYYLNPPLLRLPGFWEREFGIEGRSGRDYYPYASLYSITPDDLRWFYDVHYVPSVMTLTMAGALDRESVLRKINETFATLAPKPSPSVGDSLFDPGRYRQSIFWDYRSNVYYSNRFKLYAPTADDEVMLIFLSRFLGKRLNDELRFGERKATYGVRVSIAKRGAAMLLGVSGGIKPSEFEYAREVVEREIESLRNGSLPTEEFEADRSAVVRQLLVSNTRSEDLERWVSGYFYDSRIHDDFPDLAGEFEGYVKADVESFVAAHFVPDRQVLMIIYRSPITQGMLGLLIIALTWLTVYLMSRWLIQPIDMTRIRYVARLRIPRPYMVAAILVSIAIVAVAGRLIIFSFELLADRFLITIESFAVQWSMYGLMLALNVSLVVLLMAHVPRKLLVFDDQVRIKYLSYRSVPIPLESISEIAPRRFREVWLSRRIWRCLPLALGLLGPAVYLRRRDGKAYFFSVRDESELLTLVRELLPPPSV